MKFRLVVDLEGSPRAICELGERIHDLIWEAKAELGLVAEVKSMDSNEGSSFEDICKNLVANAPLHVGREISLEALLTNYKGLQAEYESNEIDEQGVYETLCSDIDRGVEGSPKIEG